MTTNLELRDEYQSGKSKADLARDIAYTAKQAAAGPPCAVTFHDIRTVYGMVATLAEMVARQHDELEELRNRKPAGRPPGSPNKK